MPTWTTSPLTGGQCVALGLEVFSKDSLFSLILVTAPLATSFPTGCTLRQPKMGAGERYQRAAGAECLF